MNEYQQTLKFLYKSIPRAAFTMFPGGMGLERMQYTLKLLKDPQEKIKIIHLAGTSGKGSTATFISQLLQSHGFLVGLHVSPFLIDIRERMQINAKFLTEEEFVHYFKEIRFLFDAVEKAGYGKLTYFEALTAMTFYIFWKKKVDYAVIETGMGGWYDATNTVRSPNKVCVLTKIGLDHMHILGDTLEKIALQKAMIMQRETTAFSIGQSSEVEKVFNKTAQKQGATLTFIKTNREIRNIRIQKDHTLFDYIDKTIQLKNIKLKMLGNYQAENAGLALAVFTNLAKRDSFIIKEELLRKGLTSAHFDGRFEIRSYRGKDVIIDGAHNPQKMRAFIGNLKKLYPNKKFVFIIAVKQGKDTEKMLKVILPVASRIYIGSFLLGQQDLVHISQPEADMIALIKKMGFSSVSSLKNGELYSLLRSNEDIVITGSLYFIASIYPDIQKLI